MGRKKLSMSEKIRRHFMAHPGAKPQDVAKALEVKISLVYAVKQGMKKGAPSASGQSKWELLRSVTSDSGSGNGVHFTTPVIEMIEPKPDVVNYPPHYTDGGIEVIDFLQAKLTKEEFIGYLKGNALKYGARMGKKDSPATDAGKMAWYASKLRDTLTAMP